MAGVGEASAIVGLIATAAQLSKTVYDIASKYNNAKKEIQSFGRDVGILDQILDQFDRIFGRDLAKAEPGSRSLILDIVHQSQDLFTELEKFRDALFIKVGGSRSLGRLGRVRWAFQASELQYLQARVDSMKVNLLLMMTLHRGQTPDESTTYQCATLSAPDLLTGIYRLAVQQTVEDHDQQVRTLAADSSAYLQRLRYLEEQLLAPHSEVSDTTRKRMSIAVLPTAGQSLSTRNSILSLYGHEEYAKITWDSRAVNGSSVHSASDDLSRASILVEDYLSVNGKVDNSPRKGSSPIEARRELFQILFPARNDFEKDPNSLRLRALQVSRAETCEELLAFAFQDQNIDAISTEYALWIISSYEERELGDRELPYYIFRDNEKQGRSTNVFGEEKAAAGCRRPTKRPRGTAGNY